MLTTQYNSYIAVVDSVIRTTNFISHVYTYG